MIRGTALKDGAAEMSDEKQAAAEVPKSPAEGARPDEADQEFAKAMGRLTGSVPDDAPDKTSEKTDTSTQ